jgi:hypothetical protein
MPINFTKTDFAPTCQFSEWSIPDETPLVRALAWLYLRKRFSIRFASEISFVMSTFAQLVKEVELAKGTELPPMPGLLPQLVRFGFPTPYHFALSLELETSARVEVNRRYDELAKHLVHDGNDDWDVIRSKVSGAYSVSLFTEFSEEELEELMATMKKDTNPD